VRLTPTPPAVRTLLLDFLSVEGAAATVTGIIAAGIVPAALEMMDAEITRAVEDFVHAGFPRDAAAVLLVEVDGLPAGVEAAAQEIITACVEAGGVLSGEHGIGLEKRDYMPLIFGEADLDAQARLRHAFDPDGVANPTKVLPAGSRCGDLQRVPEGAWI